MKHAAAATLVAILAAGCPGSRPPRPPAVPPPAASQPVKTTLEPGDVVRIDVFGEKDLSGKFQISDEGTIDFPLVGRVKAAGLVPPALAALLRKRLAEGYLKEPQVSVFAEGFDAKKTITVWGRGVRKPGTFRYQREMGLVQAITLAGGLTPLADKAGTTVTRKEGGTVKTFTVPLEGKWARYPLQPGDVVHVPERMF